MENAQQRLLLNKEKALQRWVQLCEEKFPSAQQFSKPEVKASYAKFIDRLCNGLNLATPALATNTENLLSEQSDPSVQINLQTVLTAYELLFDVTRDVLNETGGYTLQEFEIIAQLFLQQTRVTATAYSTSAEEKSRYSKKAFLTKMSHEIRTPLNSILGFTHLIKNDRLSRGERFRYIEIIARNGHALSHLVDDFLEIAKAEAGIATVEKMGSDSKKPKTVPIPVRYATDKILKDINILLVEDMKDNQLLIETYLRKTGAKLDIANDGAEGVDKALNKNYDVILMDIQMPVLDGNGAARKLREAGYQRPLIALTAHTMKEEVDRAMRAGFDLLVSKPIDSKNLFGVIQSALSEGATSPL